MEKLVGEVKVVDGPRQRSHRDCGAAFEPDRSDAFVDAAEPDDLEGWSRLWRCLLEKRQLGDRAARLVDLVPQISDGQLVAEARMMVLVLYRTIQQLQDARVRARLGQRHGQL
ncbi:MAG TPA: hypothetical protein VH374_00885 [Polyangia bacterium]|nr:hypothetical protein [Polyangia bacterium]